MSVDTYDANIEEENHEKKLLNQVMTQSMILRDKQKLLRTGHKLEIIYIE